MFQTQGLDVQRTGLGPGSPAPERRSDLDTSTETGNLILEDRMWWTWVRGGRCGNRTDSGNSGT